MPILAATTRPSEASGFPLRGQVPQQFPVGERVVHQSGEVGICPSTISDEFLKVVPGFGHWTILSSPQVVRRGEDLVQAVAGLAVLFADRVGVGVEGDADVGVAKPLLHDLVVAHHNAAHRLSRVT